MQLNDGMNIKGLFFSIIAPLVLPWCAALYAQEGGAAELAGTGTGTAELPRGYRSVTLGMDTEQLKDALRQDTAVYLFREDRDVYFMPLSDEHYVETTGRGFVKRAFFQFDKSALFVISLTLNPDRLDFYSVFMMFREKYGEPSALDTQKTVWESDTVRITIERPLTVKYIDRLVFDRILAENSTAKSAAVLLRDEFLNDF
jgi:hypothetical protein